MDIILEVVGVGLVLGVVLVLEVLGVIMGVIISVKSVVSTIFMLLETSRQHLQDLAQELVKVKEATDYTLTEEERDNPDLKFNNERRLGLNIMKVIHEIVPGKLKGGNYVSFFGRDFIPNI